jgi:hypothetical protein
MRGYGFQKVLVGETTIEEVLSVTAMDRKAEDVLSVRSSAAKLKHAA